MARLIDADALLEAIIDFPYGYRGMIESVIYNMPTVDAVPAIHGKWIYGNEFQWYVASCNKCGYQRRTDIKAEGWNQWNYCPNCGARMDEE